MNRRRTSGKRKPRSQWEKLAIEFPGHPHLERETLYALPLALIKALRRHAPKVLSPHASRFETRLRRLSATGFHRRLPLFSEVMDAHLLDTSEVEQAAIADRHERDERRRDQQLTAWISMSWKSSGNFERASNLQRTLGMDMAARLKGYAGWLVTHHEYRRDLFRLQFAFKGVLRRHGGTSSIAELLEISARSRSKSFAGAAAAGDRMKLLLDRWGLEPSTTLDIPEPTSGAFAVGEDFRARTIKPNGFGVFLPWHLLVDGWMSIQRLFELQKAVNDLRHLAEWLEEPSEMGHRRYAQILELYVYRERVLASRYAEQLRGNVEGVDLAFAQYFYDSSNGTRSPERQLASVRKLRGILTKRMKACAGAVEKSRTQIAAGQLWDADGEDTKVTVRELKKELAKLRRRRSRRRRIL